MLGALAASLSARNMRCMHHEPGLCSARPRRPALHALVQPIHNAAVPLEQLLAPQLKGGRQQVVCHAEGLLLHVDRLGELKGLREGKGRGLGGAGENRQRVGCQPAGLAGYSSMSLLR